MGIMIYVNGKLTTDAEENDFEEILRIKDRDEYEVFDGEDGIFGFCHEMIEGADPINSLIYPLLERVVALANERHFNVSGSIEINSEWSDYDDVTVEVTNKGLKNFDTKLFNTATEDLIRELKRRGVRVQPDTANEVKSIIHAVRTDGLQITQDVSVEVIHKKGLDLMDAVDRCFTDWYKTPEGCYAWEAACCDYNIGDMLCSSHPEDAFTKNYGFTVLYDSAEQMIDISYDRVLGHCDSDD